ncbi:MAG: GntR family transcriptional regulator [Spirochaetales bacterium]|nr:GntR family transcriptional regulator [Spirochaetales bacterium]
MEFREKKAIYVQIAESIYESILSGEMPEGQRIPSIREMAVEVQVNPNTVMRTYNYLQDEGIIYNQRGIGYFITEDAKVKTKKIMKEDFIKTELPVVFKMMDLLEIDMKALTSLYETYQKEKKAS